jgi:hypothetical protein
MAQWQLLSMHKADSWLLESLLCGKHFYLRQDLVLAWPTEDVPLTTVERAAFWKAIRAWTATNNSAFQEPPISALIVFTDRDKLKLVKQGQE